MRGGFGVIAPAAVRAPARISLPSPDTLPPQRHPPAQKLSRSRPASADHHLRFLTGPWTRATHRQASPASSAARHSRRLRDQYPAQPPPLIVSAFPQRTARRRMQALRIISRKVTGRAEALIIVGIPA